MSDLSGIQIKDLMHELETRIEDKIDDMVDRLNDRINNKVSYAVFFWILGTNITLFVGIQYAIYSKVEDTSKNVQQTAVSISNIQGILSSAQVTK